MHDPGLEDKRWLDQAENDLAFARHSMEGHFYHQAETAVAAVKAIIEV